jgi:hypothetical protein
MKLCDLLLQVKYQDRIRRMNPDWKHMYLVAGSKFDKLFLVQHIQNSVIVNPYCPTLIDLTEIDWDVVK